MRIAFADLIFSWPPNGGADVELYHVITGLQEQGIEVNLFLAHEQHSSERGRVDGEALPFPVTVFECTRRQLTPHRLMPRFRDAIDAWRPDAVFVTHGFTLKPYLVSALAHYPLAARYYAHELLCARNAMRFKDDAPCPYAYLESPDHCRRCALEYQKHVLQKGELRTWTVDYLASKAYAAQYYGLLRESLKQTHALLVNNTAIQKALAPHHPNVQVFTPGVDTQKVIDPAPSLDTQQRKKVILMTGRVDDPLKGLQTLLEAGGRLAQQRGDFEIWATHFDYQQSSGWFKAVGWHTHEETLALYPQADICVVPSRWEEPFGMVAIEAMAAARPVCATRGGGLQDIVKHQETGFLFERDDSAELAKQLELLLDNAEMRHRMGAAGRQRAERQYDWKQIIEKQYLPLIESMTR